MAVIGKMKCWNPNCGEELNVVENEKKTLSIACDFCGFTPYARTGLKVHADVLALMVPHGAPRTVAPAVPPADDLKIEKPAPKKRSAFNPFGALAT